MVKPTERRVSYGVAIGYGITDLFGGGAFAIIGTWLLFFYTTYCGLSVLEAGSIFAIARVIDAVLSPIMGYITDNFGNTWLGRRFGRRRFFLLLSSPLMFLYALLWLTDMGYWYYLGTYLSIELLSAMVLVPWETLRRRDDQSLRRTQSSLRRAHDLLAVGRIPCRLGTRYPDAVHRQR